MVRYDEDDDCFNLKTERLVIFYRIVFIREKELSFKT